MTGIQPQALRTALPGRLETARSILRAPALSDAPALGVGPVSIKARAIAENTGSRRLLEKLGFTFVSQSLGSCGPHKGVEIVSYRFGPAENTNDQSA